MDIIDKIEQGDIQGADEVQERAKKGLGGREPGYTHSQATRSKIARSQTKHGCYALVQAFKRGQDPIDNRTKTGKLINATIDGIRGEIGPTNQRQESVLAVARTQLAILMLAGQAVLKTDAADIKDQTPLIKLWLTASDSYCKKLELLDKLSDDNKQKTMDYATYVQQLKESQGVESE